MTESAIATRESLANLLLDEKLDPDNVEKFVAILRPQDVPLLIVRLNAFIKNQKLMRDMCESRIKAELARSETRSNGQLRYIYDWTDPASEEAYEFEGDGEWEVKEADLLRDSVVAVFDRMPEGIQRESKALVIAAFQKQQVKVYHDPLNKLADKHPDFAAVIDEHRRRRWNPPHLRKRDEPFRVAAREGGSKA